MGRSWYDQRFDQAGFAFDLLRFNSQKPMMDIRLTPLTVYAGAPLSIPIPPGKAKARRVGGLRCNASFDFPEGAAAYPGRTECISRIW